MAKVDTAGLAMLVETGVTVVDIRRADEWRDTGVIEGSLRLTAIDAEGRLVEDFPAALSRDVGRDEPVVLVCRSGNRSALVARLLNETSGFTHVIDATGGMRAWLAADRPVTPCPEC